MRSFAILLAALFCPAIAGAQQNLEGDTLVVFGFVKDLSQRGALTSYRVLATDVADATHVLEGEQLPEGRYALFITEERIYQVEYSSPDHLTKRVRIEVPGPSAEQWKGGFGMQVDINLPSMKDGHDPATYVEPMGIARFNTKDKNYQWDEEYTRKRMEVIKKGIKP